MAEKSILVEIVTPVRKVFSDKCNAFFAPGALGYFEILFNHAPYIVTLQIGEIKIVKGNEVKHFSTSGGYCEVLENHIIILAETAEASSEIDLERAIRSKERAEKRLKERKPDIDVERAKASLLRAINRIRVAERGR
ncbi:F0F1 ATP synthase subunit epsilon [candidate division KSB1 bacterium]|nr:MAG: F0F1 ATP synthase subunit epsilon [candidate division KSB1 bacterium]